MTVRKLLFQAILTSIIALYGCGGGGGGSSPPSDGGGGPTLVSIIVTSPSSTIAKGTSTPFTATGLYSNGTSSDVTFLAAWNSSHTAVSTVTVTGLAVSVDQGTTTISAVYSGKTATASLTVTSAVLVSLSVTPPTPSIPKGLTQQFTARGKYSDNNEQSVMPVWTSLTPSVATIDPTGLASSVAPGSATITADFSGKSSSAVLTVTNAVLASLSIAPSNTSVPKGWPQSFTATGTFTDSTTQDLTSSADWGSSNPGIATVAVGVASSLAEGSATISAIHSGKTATAQLTVTPAEPVSLSLWPPTASIANGKAQSFTATAILTDSNPLAVTNLATWDSSYPLVSTISATGLATSVAPGTTTISATYSGLTATAPLTITTASLVSISIAPGSASIAKGLTQQFTATGTYSDSSTADLTPQLTWQSSDAAVTISGPGTAFGAAVGSATITASDISTSLTATAGLTISSAVLSAITVTPVNPIVWYGATQQFSAAGVYTDNTLLPMTGVVTWGTSTASIATISEEGLATTVSIGTAVISATDGIFTGTTNIHVRPFVTLPDTGQTADYTATSGEDSDYTINPPSYQDNTDGTINDLNTNLVWQQQDNDTPGDWTTADIYCSGLSLAGYTDWRIPTRRELMTVLDLGVLQPKINGTYFLGTKAARYWSSDPIGSDILDVNFATGELRQIWAGEYITPLYVRCVRGTQFIPSSFSNNNDGTVVDYTTGLMWQQGESSPMLWDNALGYCEISTLAGHGDWRLPNAKELESLIDGTKGSPSIDTAFFPNAHGDLYWTSTVCSHVSSKAYSVNFADRTSGCFDRGTQQTYVRCVRGGY